MDGAEAGPGDRHHLGGRIQLHGAGAERDHGLIEREVLALQLAHVAQQLGLRVVEVEDRVFEESRLPLPIRWQAATRFAVQRSRVEAGLAVGEGAPHRLDVGPRGGLVAGDAEAVAVDRPQVVARHLRPLQDRLRRARRADRQRVEPAFVLDREAEALQPRREDVGQAMGPLRNAREPLRPVIDRVHAGDDAEQHLRRADVAGRLLAPDVLLAGLEREPQRLPPAAVHRNADDPPRHGAAVLLVGGEIGGVRPAVTQRHAEALRAADRDVGAELAGRRQQHQAEQVRRNRDHRALRVRLLDDPPIVGHRAAGLGVLQQDAEERTLRQARTVIAHLHLDADGLRAGLHHRDGLRQAGVGDEEAVAAVPGDAVAHVHGLGRRRCLVEQRGIGAAKPGKVHHHGLEVEQRLQPALRNLRLIGRVGGVPARVLQDVALDDGGRDGVVVAEADHGVRDAVAPGKVGQLCQHVALGAAFREVRRDLGADRGRHRRIHERVEGLVAHGLQHGRDILVARADMAADEGVRLFQSRQRVVTYGHRDRSLPVRRRRLVLRRVPQVPCRRQLRRRA